ncbi:hypothetical protein LJ656_06595 [Paraburkholderia sp. MMS20-SJTR3]|uniref:Pentapeptide MXKDX repeat protein n=1 Tax=Paraburkholderia sejongensis TaxID=2886946 RepID=A0ABS8JQW1_9BURK|nr:hypothetical protein [Paraburkholderia sp. MMS20-SJTR3]MCC8392253.1 hypothetical protein [Paraburkholderia sp. MMS20-SJTR3]
MKQAMKRITIAANVGAMIFSTCVFAQTGNNAKSASHGTQQTQPGRAGEDMSRAADPAKPQAASGTLMDKRQKAMSAEGASGASATGQMKQ